MNWERKLVEQGIPENLEELFQHWTLIEGDWKSWSMEEIARIFHPCPTHMTLDTSARESK